MTDPLTVDGTADRLPILMYHSLDSSGSVVSIPPDEFSAQMAALSEHGVRGISVGEAMRYRESHGRWPASAAALTFDDGYASVHEAALPVLSRRGFAATVYLVSGHVGGSNDWAEPPAGLGRRALLNWAQVGELVSAGIEIGAHTRTHPDLRSLPDDQVVEQMVSCRDEIAARIGRPVESFAYPFGHLSATIAALAARQFRTACTTELRRAADDPALLLPRVDAYYLTSRTRFERLLSGHLDRYLSIRRWARGARRLLLSSH